MISFKRLLLFLSFSCLSLHAFSQAAEKPSFRLFLIGDAGEGDTTGATLHDLQVMLSENPNSAVIFLGDNCYLKPYIFVPFEVGGYNGGDLAKRRLMSQIDILRGYKGDAYFVPGNHDWWNHIDIEKG